MTDPMDKLAKAMKAAPASRAKSRAAEAAMRAFDEEFAEARQETAAPARRKPQTQPIWSRLMTTLSANLRPMLMGGASVAALSLALFVAVKVEAPTDMLTEVGGATTESRKAVTAELSPRRDEAADDRAETPEADAGSVAALLDRATPREEAASSGDLAVAEREAPPPVAAAPLKQVAPYGAAQVMRGRVAPAADMIRPAPAPEPVYVEPEARDRFANADRNPVKLAAEAPVSTFSIDVDTASYAWMRRSLREGRLPTPGQIRVEELINYFPYDYPAPATAETPFAVTTTVMDAPWAEGRQLLHIGLRGYEPPVRPRANFTFLIDTSGSMQSADKLPLLLTSFRLLLDALGEDDTVAIVTYAGSSGVALEPTRVAEKGRILDALDRLTAGGSTAGAAGIETAYRLAEDRFDDEAVNRVILATDGDFNVGASSVEAMERLIEDRRDSGVFLSVLGFGRGNLNDALMQSLAQKGNGQAAYIDTLAEARKALVDEVKTMTPIARDVKIQIEFNPAAVQDYRLIGYETRALAREDFNNDKVDAGEIGAGHRVTAIYEITPVGGPARIDDLRYRPAGAAAGSPAGDASELAFLRLRAKAPDGDASELTEIVIPSGAVEPGREARFVAAVAGFGELLTGADHLGDWSYDDALALASDAKGEDRFGYRAELLDLVRLARSLDR